MDADRTWLARGLAGTPAKCAESYNGCTVVLSESDAASESDALERDRLRVGPAILARFLSKINKNGPVPSHRPELGPCWLWTANVVRGYGQFVLPRDEEGKQPHVYAHRFAYELVNGPLGTLKANHHCDVTLCVRPSHLFGGSQAENLADARRKGRLVNGLGARKLDDAAYLDILTATDRGNGRRLAKKYGVSHISISRIRNGHQGAATFGKKPAADRALVAELNL